jgi:FtsP/CotA-like multicopper oxidase with cupredoxin domain
MRNDSDDIHPIHLHRHTFELTSYAGKPTSGLMKDVLMLGGYQEAEIDFVADNPRDDSLPLSSAAPYGLRAHDLI